LKENFTKLNFPDFWPRAESVHVKNSHISPHLNWPKKKFKKNVNIIFRNLIDIYNYSEFEDLLRNKKEKSNGHIFPNQFLGRSSALTSHFVAKPVTRLKHSSSETQQETIKEEEEPNEIVVLEDETAEASGIRIRPCFVMWNHGVIFFYFDGT
jgi:hypothetical protein